MNKTSIEWTDRSVNPFRARRKSDGKVGWHCVKCSPGCASCYSEVINMRFGTGLPYTAHSAADVELFLDDEMLRSILRLKTPQKVFPCDMTDLFLDAVSREDIATFFAVMAVAEWHTFQVLTKRSERMASIVGDPEFPAEVGRAINWKVKPLIDGMRGDWGLVSPTAQSLVHGWAGAWPLPNVWLGVSTEDQKRADERIPHLLRTPAAVRFLSVEPLIGLVDLDLIRLCPRDLESATTVFDPAGYDPEDCAGCGAPKSEHAKSGVDWVIVGGESGLGSRPMHPRWVRDIRDQCAAADIAFHFKQWGHFAPGTNLPAITATMAPFDFSGPESEDNERMWPVGKKASGRLLDGTIWDQMPDPASRPA